MGQEIRWGVPPLPGGLAGGRGPGAGRPEGQGARAGAQGHKGNGGREEAPPPAGISLDPGIDIGITVALQNINRTRYTVHGTRYTVRRQDDGTRYGTRIEMDLTPYKNLD